MTLPCRAVVTLKAGESVRALSQALAVEAAGEAGRGPVTVELRALRGGRVQLTLAAPRAGLLRATLKAYLQWATCSLRLARQSQDTT